MHVPNLNMELKHCHNNPYFISSFILSSPLSLLYEDFMKIFSSSFCEFVRSPSTDFQVLKIIKLPSSGNVPMKDDLKSFASSHFHNASFGIINMGV